MDNFITLKVVTPGDDPEEPYNTHQPLQVVFNRSLQAVGGGANRDRFTLEYQDQELDLNRKIADYVAQFGWVDGAVLELTPRPEVI